MIQILDACRGGCLQFEPRSWRCTGLLYDGGVIGSAMSQTPHVLTEVACWVAVAGTAGVTHLRVYVGAEQILVDLPFGTPALTPVRVPVRVVWPAGEVLFVALASVAAGHRGLSVAIFYE